MLARVFQKKLQNLFALVCVLGINFLFLPFYHYHPTNIHGHRGELKTHDHHGHIHSAELENLAHALNAHPADSRQDKKHHHPHSSPEHDSDGIQFEFQTVNLDPTKTFDFLKDGDTPATTSFVQAGPHRHLPADTLRLEVLFLPGKPSERAPPILLI